MKSCLTVIVAMVGLFLPAESLLADNTSLRCGNALILIGDTVHEVRRECGNPVSEHRAGERKTYRILKNDHLKIEDITYVTEWIYEKDLGIYILTFEGSRLVHKEFSR